MLGQTAAFAVKRQWLFSACLLLFGACSVPQRSLSIALDQTPLYPEKQWAVVNMPYIKVNQNFAISGISYLLGTVRFGNIVEVQRIERNTEDGSMWAFILWQAELAENSSESSPSNEAEIQGWLPYDFLHVVGNFKEAQLIQYQMLTAPNAAYPLHSPN